MPSNLFKAFLASPLASGTAATTIVLDRITNQLGEEIATADFTTLGRGVLTINPDADGLTEFAEFAEFTGVTSATKTLTGVTRGLSAKSDTSSTDNMHYHPTGTPVILSFGSHQIQDLIDYLNTLVVSTRSVIVTGTAGETLVAGNLVYMDDTDNEWKKCDADTAATVENTFLGIAQGAGVDGGLITTGVLVSGKDLTNSGLTQGQKYYASNTAGGISSTPGTKEVTIGFGTNDGYLYFNPRFDQVITENQQDLIEQIEAGTDWYAASVTGTDAYAITITPAITAYATGMRFRFKADVANTGAATLAVSGLAAKTIKKLHDQTLADNDIEAGSIVEVVYDGTDMQMVSTPISAPAGVDIQTFTSSGTWTKPTGAQKILIQAWGGGGSGANVDAAGAGGGAGGEFREIWLDASSAGSTETVTIGAGGAAVASHPNNGNAGGNTTFGSLVTAVGGSGGGRSGNNGIGGNGGGPFNTDGAYGSGGGAASTGGNGIYSAGGGGATQSVSASAGGNSTYGGAGGGGSYNSSGAGGGTSIYGGNGGAGAYNATATSGSVPGGGGGANSGTGSSGAGGAGKMIVTTFL